MTDPFQSAPFEVVDYILSQTDPETVSSISQTSRTLHTYIQDNIFLWRSLFAKYFDVPKECPQPINWRFQVQSRIRAKHIILGFFSAHVADEELENVFKILVQIIRSAPPGRGQSKNITWLYGILTDPALWPSCFPLISTDLQQSQPSQSHSELRVLECDQVGWPGDRFKARTFVYDMRNYHHFNLYGPFLQRYSPDEPLRTDYVHLAYLMNVLLNNHHETHGYDAHARMKCGFENTRSMTAPPSPVEDDWAGVQGDWLRFVSWIGDAELEEYNVSYTQSSTLKILFNPHTTVAKWRTAECCGCTESECVSRPIIC